MNILALDLGKYKTVFCNYNPTNGEHEFGKVSTIPQEIHDLIVEKEPQKIVLEVCHIAGWIVDIAKALGIKTEVANTSHEAWRWKNVKKKNDREDAIKLAKLSAMNQLPTVHIPEKKVREKRALIKYRQRLVKADTYFYTVKRLLLCLNDVSIILTVVDITVWLCYYWFWIIQRSPGKVIKACRNVVYFFYSM